MKKSDLKQLIKPIVKECIQEVLLEEGLLSNVVSEVVKGMQGATLTDSPTRQPRQTKTKSEMTSKSSATRKKMQEHRKKMMHAIGDSSYNGVNLFEGTTPAPAETQTTGQTDLGNPQDSGVDISSLMGTSTQIWQKMK